ncbi:MAG: restriction endonuclease subunit S [bacterium]|nr:restriction endonuclease subunit S [bacterium]
MGELPQHWKVATLGEISKFSQYGINSPSGGGSRYPMLRMNNIQAGHLDTTDLVYVELNEDEFKHFRLEPNDILINRTNSIDLVGKSSIFQLEGDYVFASYLVRFRLVDDVYPLFVHYYLNSEIGQQILKTMATKGVSQANINPTNLKKRFTVPLPPLPEQRKIAAILSTWDEAITLTGRLVDALKRRKQALMQLLLTGEVRFAEFDGEWEEVALGQLFRERVETGFQNLPLVAITSNDGIVYRDSLDRRDTSTEDKSKYLHILPGDIGYNTMRMWQGVSGISSIEGIVSPAYTICVPQERVNANFMSYLFKLRSMIHIFWRYSQGLVDDTLSLKFNNFAKIEVSIPSTLEQSKIAEVMFHCDREMENLAGLVKQFESQKRGLMHQLLTGAVRVQVEE